MRYVWITAALFLIACNGIDKQESNELNIDDDNTSSTMLSFPEALIYNYIAGGEEKECWIYLSKDKKYLLYSPENDTITAILSHPDGRYEVFGEKDSSTFRHFIAIPTQNERKEVYTTTKEKEDIIDPGNVVSHIRTKGITLKNQKIFITTDIPINSAQLYGFSRLPAPYVLPLPVNFANILKPQEIVVASTGGGPQFRLSYYTHTAHYLNVSDYKAN